MKTHHHSGLDSKVAEAAVEATRGSIDSSTKALMENSREAIHNEFAESFSTAGGDWGFENRDELAKRVGSGDVKYEYIRTKIERVDVATENVTIVTGTRSVKAMMGDEDFASTFPFKSVHVLNNGNWQVALWAVNC